MRITAPHIVTFPEIRISVMMSPQCDNNENKKITIH
jgi:hypothetical protein